MKNLNLKLLSFAISIAAMTSSCTIFKPRVPVNIICPVCQMKFDRAEAFTYKYNGVKYYFDKYECKEVFKMDPEKILTKNNCEPKK